MDQGLHDWVVIVVGASQGLGSRIAVACARQGARVALLARSKDALDRVVADVVAGGGEARNWPVDIRDADAVRATVDEILAVWGRIDALINAAGLKVEGAVGTVHRDELLDAMAVNCLGPLAACQAVLPQMRRQGSGHVVNVSSVLGKRATPMRGAYSASKAALNAITESLRMELASTGIRVTLVCPGRLAPHTGRLNWLWVTSEAKAAERVVRCLHRPRAELVLTVAGRVLAGLNAVAPALVDRLLMRWKDRE